MAQQTPKRRPMSSSQQHVNFVDSPVKVLDCDDFDSNSVASFGSDLRIFSSSVHQKSGKVSKASRRRFVESFSSDLKIFSSDDSDSEDIAEKLSHLPETARHRNEDSDVQIVNFNGLAEQLEDSEGCENHLVDSNGAHYRLLNADGSRLQRLRGNADSGIQMAPRRNSMEAGGFSHRVSALKRGDHRLNISKPSANRMKATVGSSHQLKVSTAQPKAGECSKAPSRFAHQHEIPLDPPHLCEMNSHRHQLNSEIEAHNNSIGFHHHFAKTQTFQHQHIDVDGTEESPGESEQQRPPWHRLCVVCKQKPDAEAIVFLEGNLFHARCFACSVCKQVISGTDRFHSLDGGRQLCIPCYRSNFAPRCLGCREGIVEECVRVGPNQHYHPLCFRCLDCKKLIQEEFRRGNNGETFCRDCFWGWRLSRFVAHEKQQTVNQD